MTLTARPRRPAARRRIAKITITLEFEDTPDGASPTTTLTASGEWHAQDAVTEAGRLAAAAWQQVLSEIGAL